VDAAAKTISLTDLISKKPMVVKVSDESQLKKLPPEVAQRIAMRLRGGAAGAAVASASPAPAPQGASGAADGASAGAGSGGMQRGGAGRPDFQQLVNRLPAAALTDFQKGDAILVVSTEGTESGGVTAITVVGGVEPILAAAPGGGGQATMLSPWSLGAPGGDAGGANP